MSKKIRQGNDIDIRWSLYDGDKNPYILEGRDIAVELNVGTKRVRIQDFEVSGNTIHFVYYGKDQKYFGSYALKYIENGGLVDMVTFDTKDAFSLVEHSWLAIDEGEIPETIQLELVTVSSELSIGGGGSIEGAVRYDIAQELTTEEKTQARENIDAYSRPSTGIPASDLESGVIPDVSLFITKTVNDLTNYYLKSETYTRAEVQALISAIQGFSYEVVNALPAASADTMRKIYLVPSADPQEQNVKDEYITIDNGAEAQSRYTWEQIGSTAIDLSGYVTTTALNTALAGKQDTLVSGQNIKTVNDKSILGSGNVYIPTEKNYAQNNEESSDYIQGRPGGYDYVLYADDDITYDGSFTRKSVRESYYKGISEALAQDGSRGGTELLGMAVHGYQIPCTYDVFGQEGMETHNGVIRYDDNADDVVLMAAEGDTGGEAVSITITPANIPGGILEADTYHFPVQFPSKYIPHDSTKQDVLTFDNVPTQNSNNPVKSGGVYSDIKPIKDVIPAQASVENQLADKSFVNSSIETNTATFQGTYNLVSDLSLTVSATEQQIATALGNAISGADNNDYAFVQIPTSDATPTEIARVDRYKYNGTAWAFEWSLNNSGFTAAQWAAVNSGITSGKVGKLDALPTNSELTTLLGFKADKSEMSVTDGTGADADKTTIQLKSGTSATVLKSHQDISGKENSSNKVTSLSSTSTDTQYPSAKCVYDALYENAIISLTVNSTGTASDLIGLKVTVTNTDTSEQISEQTWNGTPLVVRIKAGVNYIVSVQSHPDYVTPVAQSFKSELASIRAITFEYVYSSVIDLSYRDTDGQKQTVQNTANSYIARVAGDYKFPAVYGNAIKNGAANADAYTRQGSTYTADFVNYKGIQITSPYIETDTGESIASAVLLWQTGANLISNVSFVNGYVSFTVNSIPTENGLAVLAVKDANGDIMWSWTIWLTTDTLTAETFTNYTEVDYDLMPENLFVIWNEGRTNYGTAMIQWGRKDAFVPNIPGSTTQMAVYDIDGNAITPGTALGSAIGVFGTDADQSADKTVVNSIKNPGMFFTRYDSTSNNWNNLAWFNNFWNAAETSPASLADNQDTAIKTIYDPCPFGWMLPAGRAFTGFTTTGDGTSTASQFNVVGSWSNGWNFKRNSTDATGNKFIASGYRASGSGAFTGVGSNGYYWSFAPYSQTRARNLNFNSGHVSPTDNNNRSIGFAVRPSRELP